MTVIEDILIRLCLGVLLLIVVYTVLDNDATWACAIAFCMGNAVSVARQILE